MKMKGASTAPEPPLSTTDATVVLASCGDVSDTSTDECKTSSGNMSTLVPAATKSNGESNTSKKLHETLTVVRFLISQLHGRLRYAPSDFHIDMILELHGLYDVVSTVYDIAHSQKCTHDSINAHLWDIEFNNKVYCNGWRHCNFNGEWDQPACEKDVDFGERRMLSELSVRKGQGGRKSGSSLSFDLVVIDVSETVLSKNVLVKIPQSLLVSGKSFDLCGGGKEGDKNATYPKVAIVPCDITGNLSEDWIGSDTKSQSLQLRDAWRRYNGGLNGWKFDYGLRPADWIPSKPLSPPWSLEEREIIGLLISSGCKFKKSWNNILQHALVKRTESSTSMKWYELAKRDSLWIEHIGRGMTNEAGIQLAKRLAKKYLSLQIKNGRTAKDPHPYAEVEKELRKRGRITDDTDECEKKRLCSLYRCCIDDSDAEISTDGTDE